MSSLEDTKFELDWYNMLFLTVYGKHTDYLDFMEFLDIIHLFFSNDYGSYISVKCVE